MAALSRAVNMRDIGGVVAADGRMVRRGLIYRSGTLCGAGPAQVADLARLGLRTIVDLRGNGERSDWPTPWQAIGCTNYWCRDHDHGAGDLVRMAAENPDDAPARIRAEMLRLYRVLPHAQREAFAATFRAIAEGRTPLLFHCAAGKDRTGVLAALILAAIDVPMAAIVADYEASNAFDLEAAWIARGQPLGPGRKALAPMLTADPAYLAAMFDELHARHGGIAGFLTNGLELEADMRDRLRTALLEPAR